MQEAQQEKTFVVSLKGIASRIAQVRYEKDNEDLKLYFVLRKGMELPSEAVSLDIQGVATAAQPAPKDRTRELLINLLKSHENAQVRLLGVILPKLEYNTRFQTFVALLSQKDFENTKTEIKLLPSAVEQLKKVFDEQTSILILVESEHTCQGILWSPSAQLRNRFRSVAGGQEKGSWILVPSVPLTSNQLQHAFLS
jgi:hypothetical protein